MPYNSLGCLVLVQVEGDASLITDATLSSSTHGYAAWAFFAFAVARSVLPVGSADALPAIAAGRFVA